MEWKLSLIVKRLCECICQCEINIRFRKTKNEKGRPRGHTHDKGKLSPTMLCNRRSK